MYDDSNLMNVTGNRQRSASPSPGTGSIPLNIMPQNAGHQPGMNLQGMLGFLGNTFSRQPQGLLSYMNSTPPGGNLPADSIGSSLFQLGQIFAASRQPQPQPWARAQGFGAQPQAPNYGFGAPPWAHRAPWMGGPR